MAENDTLPPLTTVYAREDQGVLVVGTRWEPHRVFCTHRPRGRRGAEYVVKYRRPDAASAAALISEVVCHALLRRLGIRTLSAVLVDAAPAFIRASRRQGMLEYEVAAGLHFGTLFRPDVAPAAPETWAWDLLADPAELIAIWAADSWLMNLDRGVYGNLLLEREASGTRHLIAADQSDCFLGAGALADSSFLERSRHHGAAPYLPLLEPALVTLGPAPLQAMVQRIQDVVSEIPAAVDQVPEEWWPPAGVSEQALIDCLSERAHRLDRIVQLWKWEGLSRATEGGRLLGL